MADLIAQSADGRNRWRRPLPLGNPLIVGRAANGWGAAWDDRISREHCQMSWDGRTLNVLQLDRARNPIFVRGKPTSQFELLPGEHFVIGDTTFTLSDERVQVSLDLPQPAQEQTFSSQYLQKLKFRHADAHIDLLSRLPEAISGASSEADLAVRLINLLLAGVPRASAAALVALQASNDEPPSDLRPAIAVLNWDRRFLGRDDFQPSERLIVEAVRRGESILHVWNERDGVGSSQFTMSQGVDWAYCMPVGGKASAGWAFYVAGQFRAAGGSNSDVSDPTDLRDDLKFTELAAATLRWLRDAQLLERERSGLSQFFSPVVLEALAGKDPDVVLQPRETEVTVLFCDLRGFSRQSERSAGDLIGLLHRVSKALGVTTHQIREHGGVLGDFHGDAAMGFWGWPLPQQDAPLRAAKTALAIRAEFEAAAQRPRDPLADFRVGIGIATGRAVAGKIGTIDQVKVTVFGPVVNLSSRLESLTKTLHAPILIDESTAAAVRTGLPRSVARVRRVARFRPYGMELSLEVTELLPSQAAYPALTDEHISDYQLALDDLIAGRWPEAFHRLHRVPADDRVKDFLTVFIAQHNRTPPDGWNGVIPLLSK